MRQETGDRRQETFLLFILPISSPVSSWPDCPGHDSDSLLSHLSPLIMQLPAPLTVYILITRRCMAANWNNVLQH